MQTPPKPKKEKKIIIDFHTPRIPLEQAGFFVWTTLLTDYFLYCIINSINSTQYMNKEIHIEFNRVTWYSKLLAFIFIFGVMPYIAFCIGVSYEATRSVYENGFRGISAHKYVRPAAVPSGISGAVTIGPTCAVVKKGMEKKCADKPLEIVILFTSYDGKIATTTKSDKLGKYSIDLKSGKYFVSKADTTTRLPMFIPQIFEVNKGAYTTANLKFDSGIR